MAATALGGKPDHLLDAVVALAEVERDERAVAVDAEHELGEIVGADRQPVEQRREAVDSSLAAVDLAQALGGIADIL